VTTSFDARGFLREPRRPAQVAAVSTSGLPLLGSLWFVFEEGRFWFSSQHGSPFTRVAKREASVAVIVDEFDPPNRILQVRVRGRARSEAHDPDRVYSIYRRYLGDRSTDWPISFPERIDDENWKLWTVEPESGLVVDYGGFLGTEQRWEVISDCPLIAADQ
jgi:hypothetical protein